MGCARFTKRPSAPATSVVTASSTPASSAPSGSAPIAGHAFRGYSRRRRGPCEYSIRSQKHQPATTQERTGGSSIT
jgi:hypothetical protein